VWLASPATVAASGIVGCLSSFDELVSSHRDRFRAARAARALE
jgi:hypothetical protein